MPLAFRQQRGAPAKGPPPQSPSDAVRRSSGTRPQLQQLKAQHQEATLASSLGVLSPHPDAAIRRLEAEQRRRQREAERVEQTRLESSGIKWWQTSMPNNMHLLTTPGQHAALSQEALRSKRLLVLKFFTEDCYTCKSLLPKLKKIAADNPDVLFGELNGSDPSMVPLFMELNITRVPMVHFVKGGELKAAFTVSLNPEKLAMFRAEIAAHKDDAVRPAETLALMASDAR